jgi:hypothetical protein
MKMAVFWVAAPCNILQVYRHSEVPAASIVRAIVRLLKEVACTSETSVNFYQNTRRSNFEVGRHRIIIFLLEFAKYIPLK